MEINRIMGLYLGTVICFVGLMALLLVSFGGNTWIMFCVGSLGVTCLIIGLSILYDALTDGPASAEVATL